jgi:probable HAF family extracellular repeat protein
VTPSGTDHATLWLPTPAYGLPAGLNDLGVLPGETLSYAADVNNYGEVVGRALTAPGTTQHLGFLWLPAPAYGLAQGMNPIGSLGGQYTHPFGINDLGEIVGDSVNAGGFTVAFLWLPAPAYGLTAGMHDMDTVGGAFSSANAINVHGDMVGISQTTTPPPHEEAACAWYGGQPGAIDLNTFLAPGSPWILQSANDINDQGQIVGRGLKNFVMRGFLLTPIVSADRDSDGDVDVSDFQPFQACLPGTGVPAGCGWADFDSDGDVDLGDFARMANCMNQSGPGIPALPGEC